MEDGVRRMVDWADTSTRLHDPLPLSEGDEERGEEAEEENDDTPPAP
jgi:hypothetical protein